MKPEEMARQRVDEMLTEAGWVVQDRQKLNLGVRLGVAIREFLFAHGSSRLLADGRS